MPGHAPRNVIDPSLITASPLLHFRVHLAIRHWTASCLWIVPYPSFARPFQLQILLNTHLYLVLVTITPVITALYFLNILLHLLNLPLPLLFAHLTFFSEQLLIGLSVATTKTIP